MLDFWWGRKPQLHALSGRREIDGFHLLGRSRRVATVAGDGKGPGGLLSENAPCRKEEQHGKEPEQAAAFHALSIAGVGRGPEKSEMQDWSTCGLPSNSLIGTNQPEPMSSTQRS